MSRLYSCVATLLTQTFFLLCLAQCGAGGSVGDHPWGAVPKNWAKYLAAGAITATLDVYDGDGNSKIHQDLTVDMAAGTVSAPQFKLPIGETYRFIIIFNYQLSPTVQIPYAFADFTWLVDEFSEAVSFSENDIRYDYDSQDPAVSAALSDGKIPNLDLDGDGWSNYEELRDKVDPKDANRVPIVPTVEVRGQQDGVTSSATVVVTARDNAHVEDLRLVDPVCGVTIISDTLANNVDGSVTRTLTLRLDLLSVSKNPRVLQGLADDGVTPAQNSTQTLNFTLSGNGSQPYFAFTEPEANSELEGDVVFRGIACSRNDIKVSSVKFLNQEIASAGWSGQRNLQTGDYELESSVVDTTSLPDGVNELKVEVSDISNKTGQGSRKYQVVNDSQIRIVSPVGRRWVFGNETIAAVVKNLPDSTLVVIEGDSSFVLSDSNSGSARGTLKVGNLAEETVIPLSFRAVRADGSEVTRRVEFTVRNKPQVFFQPQAVKPFRNWSTHLSYRVVNVDPGQLAVSGVSTAEKGDRTCQEDGAASGIMVCSGEFPVKVIGTQVYSLSATRAPTPDEVCGNNCSSQQDNVISSTTSLPNDLPEINATIMGDDEPEAPEKVIFPSEAPAKRYRMTVRDLKAGGEVFVGEANSGESLSLNTLEGRTDYRAILEVLDGPGGNSQQKMFKDFTTGDIGLVGWWRFKDDPFAVDCPGETSQETVCDYSGRNNPGKAIPGFSWLPPGGYFSDGGIENDGSGGYVNILSNPVFDLVNEITVSCEVSLNYSPVGTSLLSKDNPMPGPFTLDQSNESDIFFGVYSEVSGVGSWKYAFGNIMGLLGNRLRATGTYYSGSLKLFLGNVPTQQTSVVGVVNNNSQNLNIGYSPYYGSFLNGKLGDCSIYNRALSLSEISKLVEKD